MKKIAFNYRIVRNFKTISERTRFDKALSALDRIEESITAENVDQKVSALAARFKSDYGKLMLKPTDGFLSAASKFLWFRHQSPVVIYDGNALTCLRRSCRIEGYEEYRREWVRQFAERETDIQSACSELLRVKDFLLADDSANLERVTTCSWFHQRVFDKFLWWNGGGFNSRNDKPKRDDPLKHVSDSKRK
jgi:hypothetical protein